MVEVGGRKRSQDLVYDQVRSMLGLKLGHHVAAMLAGETDRPLALVPF